MFTALIAGGREQGEYITRVLLNEKGFHTEKGMQVESLCTALAPIGLVIAMLGSSAIVVATATPNLTSDQITAIRATLVPATVVGGLSLMILSHRFLFHITYKELAIRPLRERQPSKYDSF